MTADVAADLFSCLGSSEARDAVFRFEITQTRDVLVSTRGSRFDTVLGLYRGTPVMPISLPDSDNTNEDNASVHDLGVIDGTIRSIAGDTTAMVADFGGATVSCGAASSSADAVYTFNLASDATVTLDTEGSTLDTVLSLFSGAAAETPAYSPIANTNDDVSSAHDLGEIYHLTGDTGAMNADFTQAYVGCNANDAAPDAVFGFSLSEPTDVEITTEGTGDFDTVLALLDAPTPTVETFASNGSNEDTSLAQDLGVLDTKTFQVTGSTLGRSADHDSSVVTCAPGGSLSPDLAFSQGMRGIQMSVDDRLRRAANPVRVVVDVPLHHDGVMVVRSDQPEASQRRWWHLRHPRLSNLRSMP